MNRFSIAELENYTGIKAHTIRKWEERYGVLSPKRTEGNTRYYSDDELRKLLCISSLLELDYKISSLCNMKDAEREEVLNKHIRDGDRINERNFKLYINEMINTALQFDEIRFNRLFSRCVNDLGTDRAYSHIIYPLLVRLGMMWTTETIAPSQEHFITNQIKIRLNESIANLPLPINPLETWLLFLPEDEYHDIGLTYAYYTIRKARRKVIFLGASVPYESLKAAVKLAKPANLLFFPGNNQSKTKIQSYLGKLAKDFGKQKIFAAGRFSAELKYPNNIKLLTEINELRIALNEKEAHLDNLLLKINRSK
jgi:DNA-binding transcriptional MerR regulator